MKGSHRFFEVSTIAAGTGIVTMNDKHKGGFTLIEIVFSILIAGTAFAGLALAFSTGMASIKATRETSIAIHAAQQEIENMRNTSFDAIQTHGFSIPPLDTDGAVVAELLEADMKKVSINIPWTSGSGRVMSKDFLTVITRNGINRQ
ncbi:MAG: type II secretion system protein [Candidatus Tritonobacter lacicola]|nr:type II secretion system protein [Candidatus Tritonobacter lacicola]